MAPFAQKRMLAHLDPAKHPGGRPSEYKPEYCEMILAATMAEGISLTAFAGLIGVSRDAVYDWMVRHSEFSNAVSRAKAMRLLWWERKLGRATKGAVTTASIFALRNIDPVEWRDVRHTSHDVNVRVETLTDAQLFAIASGKSLSDASTIEGDCTVIDTH